MRYALLASMVMLFACQRDPDSPSKTQSWQSPDEGFRIGRGYDPDAVEQIRGDCIANPESFLEASWRDAAGIKAKLTETRLTSHEDLLRELNISVRASGSYTFYSGGGEYSKYEKFVASKDNFSWLFAVEAEVGSKTLQTERIGMNNFSNEARELIQKARAGDEAARKSFRTLCGTQFVRTVRLGGHINEVLEISARATDLIQKIHAEIEGSGGGAVWSASASASFDSVLQSANRSNMLKREYSQNGGDTITFDISPSTVQKTLDDFARNLRQGNATVIRVELVDWETLVNFTPTGMTNIARQIRLEELLKQLWRQREVLDKIDTMIYLFEKGDISLTSSEIATLRTAHSQVTAFLDKVIELGQSCYVDASACNAGSDAVIVDFPPTRPIKRDVGRFSTNKWSFEYANPDAHFHQTTIGDTTSWSSDNLLATQLSNHDETKLRTDLMETSCTSISSLLSAQGPVVLSSFLGEPLHYTERLRDYPGGKQAVISFGFKQNNNCLLFQVYTETPTVTGFTLEDDSPASKVVRSMAQSIRFNAK